MISIQKRTEPKSLSEERQKIQGLEKRSIRSSDFDKLHAKKEIQEALLEEQGHICCYCMREIKLNTMRVEHFLPRGSDKPQDPSYPEFSLTYNNLLAACNGGQQPNKKNNSNLHHCDVKKGHHCLTVIPNPSDSSKRCEDYLQYSSSGKIESSKKFNNEKREQIQTDIDILGLNQYFLVQNRKEALNKVIENLNKIKGKPKQWQSISKKIERKYDPTLGGKKKAYCGYIFHWITKKNKRNG